MGDDLWRWQVGNRGNPFGGIGSIRTRTEHGCVLLARILGPALYDKCPTGAIPKPGKDAIVSYYNLVCQRLTPLVYTLQLIRNMWVTLTIIVLYVLSLFKLYI